MDTTIAAVSSGNGVTATPATMANISKGTILFVDAGLFRETVEVLSVTASTFVANFSYAHGAGTAIALAQDGILAGMITGASVYWLRKTGRTDINGDIPQTSSFVEQDSYGPEWYDGHGGDRLFLRIWPIINVYALSVNGVSIPQSQSVTSPGWVIDQGGRCLAMRDLGAPMGPWGWNWRSRQMQPYRFARGTQNIEVSYMAGFSAVPPDVNEKCTKMVVLTFKRRGYADQKTANIPTAGTVTYRDWELDPDIEAVMKFYERNLVF